MAKALSKFTVCWPEDSCTKIPTEMCIFCGHPMCDDHADSRLWKFMFMDGEGHCCQWCVSEMESRLAMGGVVVVRSGPSKTVRQTRIEKMAVPQPGPASYSLDECIRLQKILERL